MKIARITGTVTASIKDAQLTGVRLLIADIEDGKNNVLEKSLVVSDACSAGVGDLVLITTGSAARMTAAGAGIPVDAAVVAIVDHLDLGGGKSTRNISPKRKK